MAARTVKAQFARDFVNLPEAAQVEDAIWENFQIAHLNNSGRFDITLKSRQVAWSFTAALDAVIDSIVNPGTPHLFISINLDEAAEKKRYAKAIWEAIRPDMRPAIISDSVYHMEFANGSRLISHPCRPARGKARARIYLDEMAHYPHGLDKTIYQAALPATIRGDGYIRIGSSPLGARGLFWEIYEQSLRAWPGYLRHRVPWWSVRSLCKDVPMAMGIAEEMGTEERVRAFGTDALVEIFENMFLEDFQQEYECAWLDEAVSWISWDVIQSNQKPDLIWWHARSVDEALAYIPDILAAIKAGQIEAALAAGIDVGRKHDLTEFVALGKSTTGQYPLRISVSLDRVLYDDQERCFLELISRLPIVKALVDQNGIGAQLAENLQRLTNGKAEGVNFTNPAKEVWAVEARVQAERGNTPLPMDRDLTYQIHSIKRSVSASKKNTFDNERNEKHHADKFWAWALGVTAAGMGLATWDDVEDLGHVEEYVNRWA